MSYIFYLLSSNTITLSNTSGNTINRKAFSDNWQWSTRNGSNSTSTYAGNFYSTCSSASFGYFSWVSNSGAASCIKYGVSSTVTGAPGTILAQCQAIHMSCDGQPLPVELLKFEID